MDANEMKRRTFQFAINVALFLEKQPKTLPFSEYSRQLVRCSASVGANYRAACRAKSKKDFINKLKIVEEEADESVYFLQIFDRLRPETREASTILINEGNEILSIMVAGINTTRKNMEQA